MSFDGKHNLPLILHCHVPKTAGTTVSAGFRRSFDIFHFQHFHPDPFYILTRENLEELLEIDPGLRSISSHHLRSFPLSVCDRPTFLLTFLRRPEDLFISQLRHLQRKFSSFPEQVRCLWPADTPSLTLRELARRRLDIAEAASQDFCFQTRFFCTPDAAASVGLSDGHRFGLDSYEMPHQILTEFHFVGIVEEMKKSLEVLTDRLQQWGTRVYFKLNLKLNDSDSGAKPAWLTPEDEVGQRVLAASKNDRRLHEFFRRELLTSRFHPLISTAKDGSDTHATSHFFSSGGGPNDLPLAQQNGILVRGAKTPSSFSERSNWLSLFKPWLGFKPAATDAKEAFSDSWRDGAHSLIKAWRLYWSGRANHIKQPITPPLSSDLLEGRAAEAVAYGIEVNKVA